MPFSINRHVVSSPEDAKEYDSSALNLRKFAYVRPMPTACDSALRRDEVLVEVGMDALPDGRRKIPSKSFNVSPRENPNLAVSSAAVLGWSNQRSLNTRRRSFAAAPVMRTCTSCKGSDRPCDISIRLLFESEGATDNEKLLMMHPPADSSLLTIN